MNETIAAAEFFKTTVRARLAKADGRLHPETLIISSARMAGSLMYRSFNYDVSVKPGQTIMSEQANLSRPKLKNVMYVTLRQLGNQIADDDVNRDYLSSEYSQLTFKETHDLLAPTFLDYCKATSMAFEEAAFAAAIASAILVHDCRPVYSMDKGSALAIYGFGEGVVTGPFPLLPS